VLEKVSVLAGMELVPMEMVRLEAVLVVVKVEAFSLVAAVLVV
jgi:hypothetical protein